MLGLELRFEDGTTQIRELAFPIEIGRSPQCSLRIRTWRVAKHHARIELRESGVFLDDFGSLGGTLVNGRRVAQYGPLHAGDQILIGPCLIFLTHLPGADPCNGPTRTIGCEPPCEDAYPCKNGKNDENGISVQNSQDGALPADVAAVHTATVATPENTGAAQLPAPDPHTSIHALLHHRRRLHAALLDALDLRRRDVANMSDAVLRAEAQAVLADIVEQDSELPASVDRQALLLEVVNEAVGLGPLEPLLADPAISEIMVNRYDEIFVESGGKLQRHYSGFSSEQAVLGVIERIVSPLGRRVDESSPMVDARLRDGSRVNAVIAPIALKGASMTIRKFPRRRPAMDDLLRVGALDRCMGDFLRLCVSSRKNIIVSGGTGSGKTTLLNVLSNCIPTGERIVTIEDAAELRLDHDHLVALEARPVNLEGRGRVEIRDLVRNALRMRPDRIVVGECRGGEAFDMLAAMNTGHEGSLTTLHANSPRDALSRLETMILMAGMDLPLAAVREHVAASIDLIVQQARHSSGRRLITAIVEVTGMESGRIQLQDLFRYQAGPPALFVGCGVLPEFLSQHDSSRVAVDIELFNQSTMVSHTSNHFEPVGSR